MTDKKITRLRRDWDALLKPHAQAVRKAGLPFSFMIKKAEYEGSPASIAYGAYRYFGGVGYIARTSVDPVTKTVHISLIGKYPPNGMPDWAKEQARLQAKRASRPRAVEAVVKKKPAGYTAAMRAAKANGHAALTMDPVDAMGLPLSAVAPSPEAIVADVMVLCASMNQVARTVVEVERQLVTLKGQIAAHRLERLRSDG